MTATSRASFCLALLACGRSTPAGEASIAPDAAAVPPAVVHASDPPAAAPPPRYPDLGFADIASEPIHVWVGRGEDQVIERIVSVGHADLECCRTISILEASAVISGSVTGERYHGFTDVRINARPDSIFAMQSLVGITEQARDSEAECVRQIHLHTFKTAEYQRQADQIAADAEAAFKLATSLERPIMVWHDNLAGAPQWAPVLAAGADGRLAPLTVELRFAELKLPRALYRQPPALQSEIKEAEAFIARVRNLGTIFDELRRSARGRKDLLIRPERVKVEGPQIAAKLAELREYGRCFERARDLWARVERATRDFQLADDRPAAALRELDQMLKDNHKALQRLDRLGEGGSASFPIVRCEEVAVEVPPEHRRQVARLDVRPVLAELERRLESWRELADNFRHDAIGMIVDAGLRGLNIGFSDPESARIYDAWMVGHQLDVWRKIRERARISAASPDAPAGVLNASNLILRVEKADDVIRLTPHYLLHGPFYQVADPVARIVYYESSTAEHNLGDPSAPEVPL